MIVFVTDDKKLVNLTRNKINEALFFRISCRDWVSLAGDSDLVMKTLKENFNDRAKLELLIDSGSLETFMDKTGSSYSLGVPYKESNPPGWTTDIVRPKPPTNESMLKTYRRRTVLTPDVVLGVVRAVNQGDEVSILHLTRPVRKNR